MSIIMMIDDDSSESETAYNTGDGLCVSLAKESSQKPCVQEAPLTVDERSYDDAETIDTADNSNEDEDRPLLELMKHLINFNGQQNTKLTNSQLIGILKKEFALDIANLHFISVDIYMNVLKKFLKDWPQWDEFDQVMHESRCMNDNEEVERILEREYLSLKDYLATILKASQPFASEAAQRLKRSQEIPSTSQAVPGDVVLEINCTRDQLNTLFFRKPHPEYNSTIFNINSFIPSKISVNQLTFESLLNSCYVNLSIDMNCFKYKRELSHNFKHMLVNKKLQHLTRDPPLNTHLQAPKTMKSDSHITKADLKSIIDKIQRSNRYGIQQQYDVDVLFKTINKDFSVLLDGIIDMPCTFRHYMSSYPYVRYLYEDVNTSSDKYDLQLEEKTSPMLKFHVGRLSFYPSAVNSEVSWLKLECTMCHVKFLGVSGIEALKEHFKEDHQNEPKWMCVHCDREFSALELAMCRWYHKCESAVSTSKIFE